MQAKRYSWFVLTAAAVGALVLTIRPSTHPSDENGGFDQPGAAAWHDVLRRVPIDGGDMPVLYERASASVARMQRFASRINRSIPAAQPAARVWLGDDRLSPSALRDRSLATGILDAWTPLGPGNIGGRTRVVRFHPTNPTTLFAAGVSGGIWRSVDDGASWRPIGEGLTNLNVNTLAIDPQAPDVMYAGTGEGYFREEIRGTGLPLRGGGVFVTGNGGANWRRLESTSTPDFYWVNDLELGVNDPRRIYAATRTGVWRSPDAGQTWTQLLSTTVRGGCLDLALRPDRADDVLFASCGSYEQAAVYRFPRAADSGAVEIVLQVEHQGRTSLAIAPSNPSVIYALAASNEAGPGGNYQQGLLAVFRSSAGGDSGSWEPRATNRDTTNKLNTLLLTNPYGATQGDCSPAFQNDFTNMGWYNNVIAIDPLDADRVWAAGVSWFRSDDGGRSWGMADWGSSNVPAYTHVDQHAIAFHPRYNGTTNQIAMIGNDGGVFRTTTARGGTKTGPLAPCNTGGAPNMTWTSLNHGYGVTQFYHGTAFPDGVRYIAGAQDNGTLMGQDQNADEWRLIFGGDGGYTAVNPTQNAIIYVELQWATLRRSNDTGGTNFAVTNGLDPGRTSTLGPEANYLFVTPFTMDPNTPTRLWLGGEFLYRSTNGATWSKVGSPMPDGGLISALAVRPGQSAHLVIGTHKGDILWSRNATGNFNAITFTAARPRAGWVTSIAHDERNEGVVYATYGNFGGAHVYRSPDYGATWQPLTGSGSATLPDIPVHSIVVDPDDPRRLYLGTDLGVMVSIDGGSTWMAEESGFGPAVTMWLQVVKATDGQKYLFAFTHGRGAWRVRLP
jgi:hypothetical protein